MRPSLSLAVLFATAAASVADPPTIEIPSPVPAATAGYIRFTPKTDAVSVVYIGMSGVNAFPNEELKDPKRFLLPVAGLREGVYTFTAVAASKTGEQSMQEFQVTIGKPPPGPPQPPNPPGPVIPPGPVVPDPVVPDPAAPDQELVAKFKTALAADLAASPVTGRPTKADAASLAEVYKSMGILLASKDPQISTTAPKTFGEFVSVTAEATSAKNVPRLPSLAETRRVVDSVIPPALAESQLDDKTKADLSAKLIRLGASLAEAAK